METISQRELRNDSGRIMRAVANGERFEVTSSGEPVAELRPLRRSRAVNARLAIAMMQGGPRVAWQTLRADLDDAVDQDVPDRA
ncbi:MULTISPECIES: type II toxin-antitoxin system Phd/YefM family antitoxin [unclassified Luteococcus]|uniref:type II toxin-antitoxin system Phd/YefM family antitoxin n=1 Tax=unclassified Luteococcus TaxID=2639923 RepID=UPI00313D3CF8